MAYGTEIVLGIRGSEKINELFKSLGWPQIDFDGEYFDWEEQVDLPDLGKAHLACLAAFFKDAQIAPDSFNGTRPFVGRTEFSPFCFELFFDPCEMGTPPEYAVFGVALSGRYVPTYLDYRSAHGCIEHVVLDQQCFDMMVKAREEIAKVFPPAKDFEILFVEKHY